MIPPTKAVMPTDDAAIPHDPDSPMTGDQADLMQALCEDAGEPFDAGLTQAQALARIEALREIVNSTENL